MESFVVCRMTRGHVISNHPYDAYRGYLLPLMGYEFHIYRSAYTLSVLHVQHIHYVGQPFFYGFSIYIKACKALMHRSYLLRIKVSVQSNVSSVFRSYKRILSPKDHLGPVQCVLSRDHTSMSLLGRDPLRWPRQATPTWDFRLHDGPFMMP